MAIDVVTEEIATNLEEVAEVTRRINGRNIGYIAGGLVVGVAVGFYFGRRWQREKLRAEAFEESAAEMRELREHYSRKVIASEPKPAVDELEEIVAERGYTTEEVEERPLRAPVPVSPSPLSVVPAREETVSDETQGWDYTKEIQNRSPNAPYVIHQDEFKNSRTGYSQTTYTYYAEDDVLCDTDDIPLPHGDLVVGQDNLRFGHGTDDENVVFIRNDTLQIEAEICRVPKSYEQEVLGHDGNETG